MVYSSLVSQASTTYEINLEGFAIFFFRRWGWGLACETNSSLVGATISVWMGTPLIIIAHLI